MYKKKWYESKTLWVNVISIGAILAQHFTGKELIDVELQGAILGAINLILRGITNKKIEW